MFPIPTNISLLETLHQYFNTYARDLQMFYESMLDYSNT